MVATHIVTRDMGRHDIATSRRSLAHSDERHDIAMSRRSLADERHSLIRRALSPLSTVSAVLLLH
jgi:hypothetical protein